MSPKSMLLLVSLFLLGLTASSQYTEKINTNRPGTSQGAFSVGNNVLQVEGGFGIGKEKHKLFKTKTNTFNFDYTIRYGLLIEQLEINLNGSFRTEGVKQTVGANEEKIRRTDFEFNTIGVKYLIYDPYKKPKENDSINYDELKSWKERYKFKWKNLIPAVSAYAGMNYVNTDNPFTFPTDQTISPKFVVMTQNNWWTSNAGSWVLVTNLIVDKITTDNPAFGWIITSTHTLNDKWAIFGEYQGQKSNFYSDDILRLGGAYLFNNDLQIDANIATNFKDTPSIFRVSVGASYRFDWHYKDEIIEKPGFESGIKGKEDLEEEEEEGKDKNKDEKEDGDFDELEEIENDSLKSEKTPFINDFEDGSHRDAMEQDLDERRTEQRLERERIEKEKQDKKDDKKFQKEERRRLKREAKEAKQAEKAKIKAEKEKQKMIQDIDAELDKMEQDEGVDDELQKIDEELKKLEEMEKGLDAEKTQEKEKTEEEKKAKEDEDIDAAYDKLQKDQEKAKKEEEKRRKKEEKKRLKEEKKKKKEEEKRKKAEEKKKKEEQEKNDDDKGDDNED
ncbi:transporter [Aquimarina sp. 2201CG14-23]|uniref:transporter n=1 Tax=Aquimarina mycalae TaxID=3040073 RepID=UPI002477DD1A|nr:transporter [Aquimarina sp. 2201CG14-23]MDH7445889.1 transporter [Aquimarina sp. 2201CG14-23]